VGGCALKSLESHPRKIKKKPKRCNRCNRCDNGEGEDENVVDFVVDKIVKGCWRRRNGEEGKVGCHTRRECESIRNFRKRDGVSPKEA
jgi:hypothetical protein